MSWAYVPELPGLNLESTSQNRPRALCALSSAMPIAVAFCVASIPGALSGPTSEASLPLLGVDVLTALLPGFLASLGPVREPEKASRTRAGSGQTLPESFAKFDPVSSSWKTCLPLFREEDWPLFSGTWPRWGLMRAGECFPAVPWVPAMSASGCSSLRTDDWNTPIASENEGTGFRSAGRGTPRLKGQALQWLTPTTPTARDHKRGTVDNGKSRPLSEACLSGHQDKTPTGAASQPGCVRLNALFVEWLMGFPEGHSDPFTVTEYEPWAMRLRQFLAQLHGESCGGGWHE